MKIKLISKINTDREKGFTLIESLVSISIVLIAVIGPLSLTMNAINSIVQNKNRVIASYLANEIVEDFKNYRDDFVVACSNVYIDKSSGETMAYCGPDKTGMPVNASYLDNYKEIPWKMFLSSIFNNSNVDDNYTKSDLYLDNESFKINYSFLSFINQGDSCSNLYMNYTEGYSCQSSFVSSDPTIFKRKISLTKLPNDTLKINVSVIYTDSVLSGVNQKSFSVTDFIYKR